MIKKSVTIVDVARAAGVSPSTVSHAISGKRAISPEVKHRIYDKIRELDYRPNFFAQAMKNNSTGLIGVVAEECANPSAALHINALAQELQKHSFDIVLGLTGLNLARGRDMLRRFSSGMVDGVINMLPQIDSTEAMILCGSVPVVTNLRQEFAPIILDFEGLTRDTLEYLWGQGHRKIGYIASTMRNYQGEDPAIAAFASFLASKGRHLEMQQVVYGLDTIESGVCAMEKLYANFPVTAVFTGNDQMAFGVYRWAHSRNLRVPEDISVVGFDDTPQAATTTPALTTGRLPIAELAEHTVASLFCKLGLLEMVPQPKVLKLPLIIRNSVRSIDPVD